MYLFFYEKKDEKDEKVTLQFHLFCLWKLFYKQKLNLSTFFINLITIFKIKKQIVWNALNHYLTDSKLSVHLISIKLIFIKPLKLN